MSETPDSRLPERGRALRIMIVAHAFPPMNATASHRPYSWAKTWTDMGHEVHVLTPVKYPFDGAMDFARDLSGIHVHEVPYLPLSRSKMPGQVERQRVQRWERIKTLTRRARFALATFGDLRMLSFVPMVRRGLDIARRHEPDLIIATSPPEVVLAVARSIASRTGTPWIADYRDLWFHDMLLYRSKAMSSLLGPVNRWLTRDASALVTVSRGLQQRLESYAKRDVLVCYNGFLEADQHAPVVSQFGDGRLHIVYTGRLYPEKRDPAPLFAALAELRTTMPELASRITVDFYGFDDPWLRSLISRYQAQDFVTLHGFVPYRDSVVAQRAADVLLFLDWTDAGAKGVLTGKLFEYLASGRPVLSLGSTKHSEAADLIAEAQCGVTLTRSSEVTDYLRALLASGATKPCVSGSIHQFSREAQARTLLKTLSARLFREEAPL